MVKSVAERKRDERQRMRKAGYVLLQVWVLPKHVERIKRLARRAKETKK